MHFLKSSVIFIHKFYILVVISLIDYPPSPISLNHHSQSYSPPLLASDMIFERSLNDVFKINRTAAFKYNVIIVFNKVLQP